MSVVNQSVSDVGKTLLVSRHVGAREWASQANCGQAVQVMQLFDLDHVNEGDLVVGNLCIAQAAAVCQKGAFYSALNLNVPHELRHKSLSAYQLTELEPQIQPMDVRVVHHLCRPTGKIVAITRHEAAADWLYRRRGVKVDESVNIHVSSAFLSLFGTGDLIIGTLPMMMVAQLCSQGAEFQALELTYPNWMRTCNNLDVDDICNAKGRLVGYHIELN